jgi:uncharacterized membrane protein YozB (DUF420 family)
MSILVHTHSGLRWIVLILIVWAVFNAFPKLKSPNYTDKDRKLNLFAMVAFHIQYLLGWIMYFTSDKVQFTEGWMKNSLLRFFGMEHVSMMTIAFVLLTIGYSKSKKAEGQKKHKLVAIFYTTVLILILAAIPWPFGELYGNWF